MSIYMAKSESAMSKFRLHVQKARIHGFNLDVGYLENAVVVEKLMVLLTSQSL